MFLWNEIYRELLIYTTIPWMSSNNFITVEVYIQYSTLPKIVSDFYCFLFILEKSQNIRNTNFPEKWNTYFLEVKNKKNIRKMEGGKFCWILLLFIIPLNYTLFWRSSHLWLSCTANDLRWNIIGKLEYIILFINV